MRLSRVGSRGGDPELSRGAGEWCRHLNLHRGGVTERRGDQAVQLLLCHTRLESTVRYLGIEVDDALEISQQTEI